MKAKQLFLLSAILFFGYWGCGESKQQPPQPSFVRVEGKQIVTPDGKPVQLRGINLGNWLLPEGYMFKLEVATAHWQIQQVIKENGFSELHSYFRAPAVLGRNYRICQNPSRRSCRHQKASSAVGTRPRCFGWSAGKREVRK
ncbi:hypothetical protein L0337_44315 [candidate division KSB1 bacterium]|nr:hypothetical protein [candidate division KSB1 bacterium]